MPSLLITNARVIDPASGRDEHADIAVQDGRIAEIAPNLPRSPAARVIDADGRIACPGLIDPHVHLREPGAEHKETVASGSRAAVAGGFTTVCCMPNTRPALDSPEIIRYVLDRAAPHTPTACRVFPIAAATKDRAGHEPTEFRLLAQAGAVGFSDDGDVVASAGIMLRIMREVAPLGLAFMQHCQEPTLTRGAAMHSGEVSQRLGLIGWPRVAEEIIVERDVRLVRETHCRYHVQHISSAGSVEIVRAARAAGLPVTAEASPHHLLLTHEAVEHDAQGGHVSQGGGRMAQGGGRMAQGGARMAQGGGRMAQGGGRIAQGGGLSSPRHPHPSSHEAGLSSPPTPAYNTAAKMNPPLREQRDIDAIRAGIADGTITVLATDHAPHTPDEKNAPFDDAPFGIIGLETALPLYAEALVESGAIDWPRLIALLTIEPAKLCNLDRAHGDTPHHTRGLGELFKSGPADITIIDPDLEWTIQEPDLAGMCVNTPFLGRTVRGRAVATIVAGEVRHDLVITTS